MDRLIGSLYLAAITLTMTAWIGLIGYGAWHFLF